MAASTKSGVVKGAVRIVAACAGISFLIPVGASSSEEWATGHITLGGPWTYARSIAVVTDQDSIDGFFFPAPPPGSSIKAAVNHDTQACIPIPYGSLCSPYDLNINFHGSTQTGLGREWIGGCSSPAPDEVCTVPDGAVTGEVTAALGAELDVIVRLLD